jgi:erythronate-4-phosphate dehydrogenase
MFLMRILIDEDIPYARETFSDFPELHTMSGRGLTSREIQDAEVLIVRSITQVNAALLEQTQVKYVGSATIGTDHIDLDYLKSRGIGFASAPGSNARAVAEYVTAALVHSAHELGRDLESSTLGIVGAGHCGTHVSELADVIGMRVLLNDPPLARKTGDSFCLPLEDLRECEFLTFHVPLTRDGEDPTYHMVNREFLQSLKPGAVLINTCRGGVVDEAALKDALDSGHLAGAVCDVWENEPDIDVEMLKRVLIGTPHIAGHSQEGKARAVMMIREKVCDHFNLPQAATVPEIRLDRAGPRCVVSPMLVKAPFPDEKNSPADILRLYILGAVSIIHNDRQLRSALGLIPRIPSWRDFTTQRNNYRYRSEFAAIQVLFEPGWPRSLQATVRRLGFRVEQA